MMSASKSTATPPPSSNQAEGEWIEVKSKRTKPKKDAASPSATSANGKANPKQAGGASKADAAGGSKQRKNEGAKNNQPSKDASPASPKGQASGDDQSGSKPQKRKNFAPPADDALKEKWLSEVSELKAKVITRDDFNWKLVLPESGAAASAGEKSNPGSWANLLFRGQQAAPAAAEEPKSSNVNPLNLIGGLDLSYMKGDNKRPVAVAALVVCAFPSLEVVYQAVREVKVDEPYLSGFLSFREVPHFLALLNDLKEAKPELVPQLLIVDGNGLLHQKGFGLACHLGVLANLPTIGVAKKLFSIDGINEQSVRLLTAEQPLEVGEAIELRGRSGTVHGAMMQTKPSGRAIFLSVGHRISLKTAVDVVRECCPKTKLPVPVEVADIKSREEVANVEQRIAEAIQRRKEKKAQYEAQREQRLAENAQRRKERDQQRKERGGGASGSPKENGANNKSRGSPRGNFDRSKGGPQGKGAQGAGRAAIPRTAQGGAPHPGQQIRLGGPPKPLSATQPAAAATGTTTAAAPAATTTAAQPTTTGAAAAQPAAAAAAGSSSLAPAQQPTQPTHVKTHAAKVPQGNKAQQQAKGQPSKGKQLQQPSKQN